MTTKIHILDSENTSFTPTTANEAIILFGRLRRKGMVRWDYVPELFQQLSAKLSPKECDIFTDWIVNPYQLKATPGQTYFADLCKKDEAPLPPIQDRASGMQPSDEKTPDPVAVYLPAPLAEQTREVSHLTPEDHNTPCDTCS